jgi:hypothetical protein
MSTGDIPPISAQICFQVSRFTLDAEQLFSELGSRSFRYHDSLLACGLDQSRKHSRDDPGVGELRGLLVDLQPARVSVPKAVPQLDDHRIRPILQQGIKSVVNYLELDFG